MRVTPAFELGARATPRGSSSDAGRRACVEFSGALWFAAWLILIGMFITPGCQPARTPERAECSEVTLGAIQAECLAREVEQHCNDDPERLCPELVNECVARIDAWEACR